MYNALSSPPDPLFGHEPDKSIYRSDWGKPYQGKITIETEYSGVIISKKSKRRLTNQFNIAYTQMGNKGPVVAFLHGVPTNRIQWYPIQKRMAPFCRTISFDMLGLGESDHPSKYGSKENEDNAWEWKNDVSWVEQLMDSIYPNEKFIFIADDWGGGIALSYAEKYNNRLKALILLDPIAFDGYPVNEIQAIGRASGLESSEFRMAMGDADQTFVQIFKTMVRDSSNFNQYNLRDLMFPYIDTDYERSAEISGENATSETMRLKFKALRVLADRSRILSPALLLPYHHSKNPKGIRYDKIKVPTLIAWGEKDNMMPANQIYRFSLVLNNADVSLTLIRDAGHYAGIDQPDRVAEEFLNFIRRVVGTSGLGDIFLGFSGIWKGDEKNLISQMRQMYLK